jgi:hypothetical protein
MLRKVISLSMITLGMLMVLSGMGALIPPAGTQAQTVPQPTPRPPLREGGDDSDSSSPAVGMAHVTGTVIDQATGAPVPFAMVTIGAQTISADANGNYDLWLESGSYTIVLASDSGMNSQPVQVELPAGQEVVQHLSGVSAAPPAAPSEVPAAPAAPAPEPAAVQPTAALVDAPVAKSVDASAPPARLPETAGNPLFLLGAWFWVSLGVGLVAGGLLIGARADSLRRPAQALASYAAARPSASPTGDAAALLAALLTTEIRAARPNDDDLLQTLLQTNPAQRRAAQTLLADLLTQPMA